MGDISAWLGWYNDFVQVHTYNSDLSNLGANSRNTTEQPSKRNSPRKRSSLGEETIRGEIIANKRKPRLDSYPRNDYEEAQHLCMCIGIECTCTNPVCQVFAFFFFEINFKDPGVAVAYMSAALKMLFRIGWG